ncbi:polya polymerase [Vallitalea okinawensis]|uniref:polya polymerase n=1 Tax=Vallitalea okinawensis TaxID=2078660 RepID=UPI000CFDD482|nr:polya polymerase [Vallitalea okinawensis]
MKITLSNIKNTEGLFERINKCKGKVELITNEGDVLNMKSKLSQIIMVANLLDNPIIKEMQLKFYEEEDFKNMMNFLMSGDKSLGKE